MAWTGCQSGLTHHLRRNASPLHLPSNQQTAKITGGGAAAEETSGESSLRMHLLQQIQSAVQNTELDLTLHAQIQMTSRHIAAGEVRQALCSPEAEVIEDYPEDPRGPSCLVYGRSVSRILHIHLSHPPEIVVITAYEPDPARWEADLKTRKRQ